MHSVSDWCNTGDTLLDNVPPPPPPSPLLLVDAFQRNTSLVDSGSVVLSLTDGYTDTTALAHYASAGTDAELSWTAPPAVCSSSPQAFEYEVYCVNGGAALYSGTVASNDHYKVALPVFGLAAELLCPPLSAVAARVRASTNGGTASAWETSSPVTVCTTPPSVSRADLYPIAGSRVTNAGAMVLDWAIAPGGCPVATLSVQVSFAVDPGVAVVAPVFTFPTGGAVSNHTLLPNVSALVPDGARLSLAVWADSALPGLQSDVYVVPPVLSDTSAPVVVGLITDASTALTSLLARIKANAGPSLHTNGTGCWWRCGLSRR